MFQDIIIKQLQEYHPIIHNIKDNEYSIEIKNQFGNSLYIGVDDEVILSYKEWHCHYQLEDLDDLEMILDKIKNIIHNKDSILLFYHNNQCIGSASDTNADQYTKTKIIKFIHTFFPNASINIMKGNGILVKVVYWDESKNNELYISKEEFVNLQSNLENS